MKLCKWVRAEPNTRVKVTRSQLDSKIIDIEIFSYRQRVLFRSCWGEAVVSQLSWAATESCQLSILGWSRLFSVQGHLAYVSNRKYGGGGDVCLIFTSFCCFHGENLDIKSRGGWSSASIAVVKHYQPFCPQCLKLYGIQYVLLHRHIANQRNQQSRVKTRPIRTRTMEHL